MSEGECLMVARLLKNGLRCFTLYSDGPDASAQEEKEVLDYFAGVFTVLDVRNFSLVFKLQIGFLYERVLANNAMSTILQHFLANSNVSRYFADILLTFLVERIDQLGNTDDPASAVLLRLFKLVWLDHALPRERARAAPPPGDDRPGSDAAHHQRGAVAQLLLPAARPLKSSAAASSSSCTRNSSRSSSSTASSEPTPPPRRRRPTSPRYASSSSSSVSRCAALDAAPLPPPADAPVLPPLRARRARHFGAAHSSSGSITCTRSSSSR